MATTYSVVGTSVLRDEGPDKVSGNANLKDLFLRLKDDGEIKFVEDHEDGSFVDVFELREYNQARLAIAAKKKAEAEAGGGGGG